MDELSLDSVNHRLASVTEAFVRACKVSTTAVLLELSLLIVGSISSLLISAFLPLPKIITCIGITRFEFGSELRSVAPSAFRGASLQSVLLVNPLFHIQRVLVSTLLLAFISVVIVPSGN
jgi:hypothetical protein